MKLISATCYCDYLTTAQYITGIVMSHIQIDATSAVKITFVNLM